MTLEELKALPPERQKELASKIKGIRQKAKTVNYSALYGVGAKKLARSTGISVRDAQNLLEAFWKINWAVKAVAGQQYIKHLPNGEMWVKNSVSGFYHSLRYEKDVWSTVNQSTGVYCFDKWIALCRSRGIRVCMQFHDEQAFYFPDGEDERYYGILKGSIATLNKHLKLNVPLDVDVKFGKNYAEVH